MTTEETPKINIKPRLPDDYFSNGFTEGNNGNDIFGLKGQAESIINICKNVAAPLTMVLDGEWGTGKSAFAKQLAGEMRKEEHGFEVIELDVFKYDFHDDPFTVLCGTLFSFLNRENENDKSGKFVEKTREVGKNLLPVTTDLVFKALTAGIAKALTAGIANAEDAKKIIDAFKQQRDEALDKRIMEFSERQQDLEDFKTALSEFITQKSPEKPLVLVIDELDRCRPSFALEMLEIIKHFFDIENMIILLVTNLNQLEAAVSGAVGEKIDAKAYLEKFYDFRFSLQPNPQDSDTSVINKYLVYLSEKTFPSTGGNLDLYTLEKTLWGSFFNERRVSLRRLEKIMSILALHAAKNGQKDIAYYNILVGLVLMREFDPQLYQKAVDSQLTWEEAKSFFEFNWNPYAQDEPIMAEAAMWAYLLLEELPQNQGTSFGWVSEMRNCFPGYIHEPNLKNFVNQIEDFYIPESD